MATDRVAVLLTGAGKRYDIVSAFAQHAFTIAADPNPLAPAQYAADLRVAPPPFASDEYVPFLEELVREHGVGAVVPLTDLDIEILGRAGDALPAFVPPPEVARATFDKWEAHELLLSHGLPSPPTVLPGSGEEPSSYPVVVKPRRGSGARSVYVAADAEQAEFFARYIDEDVMVQKLLTGDHFSIDLICDLDGRCLNAIPRSMLESRGGESIKGTVTHDDELIELGRRLGEALPVRGPCTFQVFRDPDVGVAIYDVNTRFGGGFPSHMYAARPGRTYPELIVRMARREAVEPHVGDFEAGMTFTRWFWQTELDDAMNPTGRDIVDGGPRPPR
jgi:carbamoyl-phosphate synthase large subunit